MRVVARALLGAFLTTVSFGAPLLTIPCSNSNCWQDFNPATVVEVTGYPTNPYWVNASQDGPGQSLAFYFKRILDQSKPELQYYTSGLAKPNDVPENFYFQTNPGSEIQIKFLMGITISNLEFGWYPAGDPLDAHPLFQRTGDPSSPFAAPTGLIRFTPTTSFGFYMKYLNVDLPGNICYQLLQARAISALVNVQAASCYTQAPLMHINETMYMQTSLQATGPGTEAGYEAVQGLHLPPHQHFVVLRDTSSGDYVVGMEDAFGRDPVQNAFPNVFGVPTFEGTGDYQDLVVLITNVPESSTLIFIGIGLAAFGGLRLRRRR